MCIIIFDYYLNIYLNIGNIFENPWLFKKQSVIDKLKLFFERYFGIGGSFSVADSETIDNTDAIS